MPRESEVSKRTLALVEKVTPLDTVRRLRPPDELTAEQKAEFLKIVNTMPAEWFVPSHVSGLVQLCRHVILARRLAELLEAKMSGEGDDSITMGDLIQAQATQTRLIARLMTMLRLTPQSIEPARVSTKKVRKAVDGSPWDEL